MSANASSIKVVPVGARKCRPFLLDVMVMSPEAGFKFEVSVEKACTCANDPIWKLVFDLFQKQGGNLVQIVHVSFTAGTDVEAQGIRRASLEGVSPQGVAALKDTVYPVAKQVGLAGGTASAEQNQALLSGMSKVATS